jgi:hypothetical protein
MCRAGRRNSFDRLPARPEKERCEPPPPSPEELEAQREMDDLTDADFMYRGEDE